MSAAGIRSDVEGTVYRWLCRTHRSPRRVLRRAHPRLWAALSWSARGPLRAEMYGLPLWVPVGDRRPVWAAEIPSLGTPIVAAVHLARATRGRPVAVVDVGAAVGDTAALVLQRCPGEVGRLVCIEGHPDFFRLLIRNLDDHLRPAARGVVFAAVHALLAEEDTEVPALLEGVHAGTAAVGGGGLVRAVPLDDVLPRGAPIDVLKIDTDGFDGRILAGARRTLATEQPVVVFEWSPIQYTDLGSDLLQPFEVLASCGYERFLLYSKEGRYVGDVDAVDADRLGELAAGFEATRGRGDDYVDVLALPPDAVCT